tara:strand:+ start:416 stop:2137 length:1722 start_codon:yes stop_codon:yes gene_type:complete
MSQSKVNLKSRDISADAVRNVQSVTQVGLNRLQQLAKNQLQERKETQKALLLGSAKTDQLIESYITQTKDANTQMSAEGDAYVRQEAEKIGKLYANSIKPGASAEDRKAYTDANTIGLRNLQSIATTVSQVSSNENVATLHTSAVSNNSALNRLTRDAQQQTKHWNFQSVLGTGQFKDLKIKNDDNNQVNISATSLGDNNLIVDINASAFNNALLRTGETSSQQVIQKDDIIIERDGVWFKSFENELKGITGLLDGVKKVESKFDRGKNKKTVVQSEGPVDIYQNLIGDPNNKQLLLGKTGASSFNKTWDQLELNGLLGDNPLKDISWNTFNNKNVDVALKKLNENYDYDSEGNMDPTPDDGKFTADDYKKVQDEMRNLAADGMAKLAERLIGNRSETVVSIKELDDYYKITNKTTGKSEYTPSGKQTLRSDYDNLWTSKLTNSIVNAEFNDFKGVVREIENNPKAFGVDTKGGFDVATGAKIKEMFPGVSFGTMQDDAVYEFNKKDPQRNEIITKPEFFNFDSNGGLDENGKNTMWNLLGVDDYEQAIFSNPTEMKLVYPNYKPSASSYQKK